MYVSAMSERSTGGGHPPGGPGLAAEQLRLATAHGPRQGDAQLLVQCRRQPVAAAVQRGRRHQPGAVGAAALPGPAPDPGRADGAG